MLELVIKPLPVDCQVLLLFCQVLKSLAQPIRPGSRPSRHEGDQYWPYPQPKYAREVGTTEGMGTFKRPLNTETTTQQEHGHPNRLRKSSGHPDSNQVQ